MICNGFAKNINDFTGELISQLIIFLCLKKDISKIVRTNILEINKDSSKTANEKAIWKDAKEVAE